MNKWMKAGIKRCEGRNDQMEDEKMGEGIKRIIYL
jgi:hypothetical protein